MDFEFLQVNVPHSKLEIRIDWCNSLLGTMFNSHARMAILTGRLVLN